MWILATFSRLMASIIQCHLLLFRCNKCPWREATLERYYCGGCPKETAQHSLGRSANVLVQLREGISLYRQRFAPWSVAGGHGKRSSHSAKRLQSLPSPPSPIGSHGDRANVEIHVRHLHVARNGAACSHALLSVGCEGRSYTSPPFLVKWTQKQVGTVGSWKNASVLPRSNTCCRDECRGDLVRRSLIYNYRLYPQMEGSHYRFPRVNTNLKGKVNTNFRVFLLIFC